MAYNITTEVLIEYATNELRAEERANIEAFLETNPKAKQFVQMYMNVVSITSKDDTVEASEDSIQRARGIWQEVPQATSNWLSKLDAIVAELMFDSRVQRATVRGSAGSREFEFKTDSYTVDVRLEQSLTLENESWVLTGQIDFIDEAGAEACISVRRKDGGEEVVVTNADNSGFFTMQGKQDELEVLVKVDEQWTHLQGISFT